MVPQFGELRSSTAGFTNKNAGSANAQEIMGVQKNVFRFNQLLQNIQDNGEIVRMRLTLAKDDEIVALRRGIRGKGGPSSFPSTAEKFSFLLAMDYFCG